MTITDRLKQAIETQNWTDVIQIYQELGGDSLNLEKGTVKKGRKKKVADPEYIQAEIVGVKASPIILSPSESMESQVQPQRQRHQDSFITSTKGSPKKDAGGGKKVMCRTEPFDTERVKINTFYDDKTIATQDIEFSRKVIVKPPTPRNRPEFREVEARCVGCGDRAYVHPMFSNTYRCERCSPRISN
jgi:hypothetical protein